MTSLLTSLTKTNPGGAQLGRVEPVMCRAIDATGSQSLSANAAYLVLVRVVRPVTVTKLSVYTSAATANVDLAILDGAFTKLAGIAAPVAAVAGGLTTGALTASFTYQPGIDYYHAVLIDASVATIRGLAGVAVILNSGSGAGTQCSLWKSVGQSTIPASVAVPAANAGVLWIAGHN